MFIYLFKTSNTLKLKENAGDTQLYDHCKYEKSLDLDVALSECIDDFAGWMETNHLKLNSFMTEIMRFFNGRNDLKIPSYGFSCK